MAYSSSRHIYLLLPASDSGPSSDLSEACTCCLLCWSLSKHTFLCEFSNGFTASGEGETDPVMKTLVCCGEDSIVVGNSRWRGKKRQEVSSKACPCCQYISSALVAIMCMCLLSVTRSPINGLVCKKKANVHKGTTCP